MVGKRKNKRVQDSAKVDDFLIGLSASDDSSNDSQQILSYHDLEEKLLHDDSSSHCEEYFDQESLENEEMAKTLARKIMIINKIRECFGLRKLEKVQQPNEVEKQIWLSLENLMTILRDCNESVNNVRLATIQAETERLRQEREFKNLLLSEIEKEHKVAAKKFCQINKKWKAITLLNDPLDIHGATNEQRDRCIALLERKDAIITKLKSILKTLDILFANELLKEEEELNILIDRIDEELCTISAAYGTELSHIEIVSAEEKNKFINRNRDRWNDMVESKRVLEDDVSKARYKTIEEHVIKMDTFTLESNEKLRKSKLDYLKHLRELTLKVEEIRGVCELNKQKLKYNYHILQMRDEEQYVSKLMLQRTINSLREKIDRVKTKALQENKNMEMKLKKVNNELHTYVGQINDADKKAENIGKANDKKYFQLWDYNQKVADDLIKKILSIEKDFYERQLQVPWEQPLRTSFDKEMLPSYVKANKRMSELPIHQYIQNTRVDKLRKSANLDMTQEALERRKKILKYLFETIVDKSKFLSENNLDLFMEELPEENIKTLIRIDQIFEALGIHNKEDMIFFSRYLFPNLICHICNPKESVSNLPIIHEDIQLDNLSDISSLHEEHLVLKHLEHTAINRLENSCDIIYKEFCEGKETRVTDDFSRRSSQNVDDSVVTILKKPICGKEQLDSLQFGQHYKISPKELEKQQSNFGVNKISAAKFPLYYRNVEDLCHAFSSKGVNNRVEKAEASDAVLLPCKYPDHIPLIPTIQIINAIREFMLNYYNINQQIEKSLTDTIISRKRHTISRLLNESEVESYWLHYKHFFNQDKQNLWNAFQIGMNNYIKDLRKREKLSESLKKIKKTNSELKKLLRRYIEPKKEISAFESIVNKVKEEVGDSSEMMIEKKCL